MGGNSLPTADWPKIELSRVLDLSPFRDERYPVFPPSRRPSAFTPALVGGLLATLGAAAGLRAAAAQAPAPERVAVEVRLNQSLGKIRTESMSNVSYERAYAPIASPLAEASFRWLRASPSVSYARSSQWLADGLASRNARHFSGCRVYREGADGAPEYRWESLDRAIDTLLAAGLKPVIVCGGMPDALAAPGTKRGASGGMAGPPKDYRRYQTLIEGMVRHVEKTYGREEVRSWYFEVWDQPDRPHYWIGAGAPADALAYPAAQLEPFLRLYDHFAAGIMAVNPQLRFGGPGVAGDPRFMRAFVEHCAKGRNFATGQQGTRVDFLSLHAADPVAARSALRATLKKDFPALAESPIFVSVPAGASGSVTPNPAAMGPGAAVRLCESAQAYLDGGQADDLSFQEVELSAATFAEGPALITQMGRYTVPMPALRAAMLLGRLDRERVAVQGAGPVRGLATKAKDNNDGAQVLLYRAGSADGQPTPVRLRITGMPRSMLRTTMRVYVIDGKTQDVYGDWVAAGKPDMGLDEFARKYLGNEIYPATRQEPGWEIAAGTAQVDLDLQPDSVVLVTMGTEPTLKPIEIKTLEKGSRARRFLEAEQAYYEGAGQQTAKAYDQAERAYQDIAKKYPDMIWASIAVATMVEMYDIDMRQPLKAEAARNRLLAMHVDELEQERILRQSLVFAVRGGNQPRVQAIQKEIAALGAKLATLAPETP
jgi:xylan 1,4-beta-xylosidase